MCVRPLFSTNPFPNDTTYLLTRSRVLAIFIETVSYSEAILVRARHTQGLEMRA